MRAIGIVGWSGAGKTTLITRLIPELNRRGLAVSTIKHAHHGFDIDLPGKDSFAHRAAGASEVLVASSARIALMRELRGAPEPSLIELLRLLAPVDLVLIEGYKREPVFKIEVFRAANGKPPLYLEDPLIVALASDGAAPANFLHASLDDMPEVAELVVGRAESVEALRDRLAWAQP